MKKWKSQVSFKIWSEIRRTVFLPGESDGQRSLVGHSPWGCRESDTTERLSTQTCASCIPTPWRLFLCTLQFLVPIWFFSLWFSVCASGNWSLLFRQKQFLYPFKSTGHRLRKRHNWVDRFMSLLVSRWTLTFSQETNIPCPDWILPFLLLYFSSLILLCKLCPSSSLSKSPSNMWDDEHRYQDLDCEQNPVFSPLLFSFTKISGGKMG